MSSAEKAGLPNHRRELAQRFVARIGYAYLLGTSVPLFGFVFDILFSPDRSFTTLMGGAAGSLTMMLILNTLSIAIITFTGHQRASTRPAWWVLPGLMGLLVGLLLVGLYMVGITQAFQNESNAFVVENEISAFSVGAIAGLEVGIAYTLSIPGIRQDTLIRQARRSILFGGVTGIQYGVYWLIREAAYGRPIHIYNMQVSIIAVPVFVISLLLSFVLGVELGDRYIERQ